MVALSRFRLESSGRDGMMVHVTARSTSRLAVLEWAMRARLNMGDMRMFSFVFCFCFFFEI